MCAQAEDGTDCRRVDGEKITIHQVYFSTYDLAIGLD